MNVFKLAVTIITRHWSYLLIYTLALGGMAILGSGAIETPQASEFSSDTPKVAVIDRDGSEISNSLKDFALKDAVEVSVDDSTFTLQDAAAKDLASYVLIVPEGFQENLMNAARNGDEAPALLVQLQNPVDGGVAVHLLGPKAILHCLGIFFDSLNVQHIYLTPFLVAL